LSLCTDYSSLLGFSRRLWLISASLPYLLLPPIISTKRSRITTYAKNKHKNNKHLSKLQILEATVNGM